MPRKRVPHEVDSNVIEGNAQSPEIATFAKTLNSLLTEKEIHQEDMVDALGIARGGISKYRNGKSEPGLSIIIKIANFLGVDCHYLMTGIQAKNYVCSNELGLSEKAINAIKASEGWGLDVLNCFLENQDFFRFLLEVRRFAEAKYRLKVAEADLQRVADNGRTKAVIDLTEKRIVQEYWTVENFKELQNAVVEELISHKDFQKMVDMVDRAVKKGFDPKEAQDNAEH